MDTYLLSGHELTSSIRYGLIDGTDFIYVIIDIMSLCLSVCLK